jgi:Ran GTPase-activating protein (RanGAP) involved in mRNA processing and transport
MKSKILQKYFDIRDKSDTKLVNQVVKYLEAEPEYTEDGSEIIKISFPGNDKYNFNSRIRDEDLQPIGIAFMNSIPKLFFLNLSYNKITDKGMLIVSKLLEFAENIMEVNLAGNQIGDLGCERLGIALRGKNYLHTLNLNTNIIGNSGAMHINELLFTNPAILYLDLGNNRYDWDGLIAITTALTSVNTTLQVLNVDDPMYKIQDQDFFTHFGKMFLSNKGLKKISMRLHKLRFEGVNILTHHLKLNSTIRVLDLSCNQICFQGVKFISDYLSEPKTALQSLILSSNKLCDQGAKIFAQGIALNSSIVHVDLTSNSINNEGLCRLAEGFAENSSVKSLKLFWNNKFDVESINMFYDVLKFKEEDFYPDFKIYYDVTGEIGIAYLETHVPNESEYMVI